MVMMILLTVTVAAPEALAVSCVDAMKSIKEDETSNTACYYTFQLPIKHFKQMQGNFVQKDTKSGCFAKNSKQKDAAGS